MTWFLLGLLSLFVSVATPLLMILALPFLTKGENVLPKFLQWLNTPDDPGQNQGMYEKQVKWWYDHLGWYLKTWYWLGWRNQLYGLYASILPKYQPDEAIAVSEWWKFKIYSYKGYKEITWPMRRVSFGYKIHTLLTAKPGDPIWWVFMPAFWKSREY